MPNYITNKLTIIGKDERIKDVLDFIKIEKEEDVEIYGIGTMDFNKITPMPKWVYRGILGEDEIEKYGEENCWKAWAEDNWGTKWNAFGQPDKRNSENTLYFETAWNGVPKLISKLSLIFPDVVIEYSYCDEDTGYNVAQYVFKEGKTIGRYVPDGGTKEAYELAFKIHMCNPEDMDYKFNPQTNEYEWIGED